ncbi:MAG: DUF748 domain-containing protein [Proteobacteria bacterium]|nr:DUF748 domain-containing protein [Pseudomonadota bacterium]
MPHTASLWLRRLAWVLLGLLLLLVLAFATSPWSVPALLRDKTPQWIAQSLGRQASVGPVAFNPLKLRLQVDDLRVRNAANTADALRVQRADVQLSWRTLWGGKPQITALLLQQPQLRIVREPSGAMDFDDILRRLTRQPAQPASAPQTFALRDARITDGSVVFDDQAAQVATRLTGLNVNLPELSTLAGSNGQMRAQASAMLNGAPLKLTVNGAPFATTSPVTIVVQLQGLQLATFAPYQPATLPIRLEGAMLSIRLQTRVMRAHPDTLTIAGSVQVQDGQVQVGNARLAGWKNLDIQLASLQPLTHVLNVGAVRITGLSAQLARTAHGLQGLSTHASPPQSGTAPKRQSASAPQDRAGATNVSVPAAAPPQAPSVPNWTVHVGAVVLTDSHLQWHDTAVRPAVDWTFAAPMLRAGPLTWPLTQPVPFKADITGPQGLQVQIQGDGNLQRARAQLSASHLDPQLAAPYAAPALGTMTLPRGLLGAQATLAWQADTQSVLADVSKAQWTGFSFGPAGGLKAPDITVRNASLRWAAHPQTLLLNLGEAQIHALAAGRNAALHASLLAVSNARIDLHAHTAQVASVRLLQPQASIARDSNGQWSFTQWLPPDLLPKGKAGSSTAKPSPPWRVQVRQAQLEGGRFYLADTMPRQPVVVAITRLDLSLHNATWPQTHPTDVSLAAQISDELQAPLDRTPAQPASAPAAATSAPANASHVRPPLPLGVSTAPLDAGAGPAEDIPSMGTLAFTGQVSINPLHVHGKLDARDLPAQIADNYMPPRVNAEVLRAPTSAAGEIDLSMDPQGPSLRFDGQAGIKHFAADTLEPHEPLLGWNSLLLDKLQITHNPNVHPTTDINIGQVALRNFYARVVLSADAKLNLTQVFKPLPEQGASAAAPSGGTPAVVTHTAPAVISLSGTGAAGHNANEWGSGIGQTNLQARPAAPLNPDLVVNVGGISLSSGRVDYTDHFIRPNYSTSLSAVEGAIGPFGTANPKPATVALRGIAQDTAPVALSGTVNPLVSPPQLDLQAKMTDLQLAPLSPYSGRYAGYNIKRGLLSMNVHYAIDSGGHLKADNQLILNQLTFGSRVNSPDATKLPVLLAVELLKDRNGNIDLNIPISGSLNDPEFSLGAVIAKAVVHLLARAITAPFTLLGHLLGGGVSAEQLSHLAFLPGTTTLKPADEPKLADIARALKAKPELILTITGEVDPAAERDAYREARLNAQMVNLWKRDLPRAEAYAAAKAQTVSQADYARVLAAVYRATPLPAKPRDVLGLPKTIPEAEMQKLLLQNIPAGEDRMQALAMERAVTLRTALDALGVPGSRQFIAAPVLVTKPDASWTPQASLSLTLP